MNSQKPKKMRPEDGEPPQEAASPDLGAKIEALTERIGALERSVRELVERMDSQKTYLGQNGGAQFQPNRNRYFQRNNNRPQPNRYQGYPPRNGQYHPQHRRPDGRPGQSHRPYRPNGAQPGYTPTGHEPRP